VNCGSNLHTFGPVPLPAVWSISHSMLLVISVLSLAAHAAPTNAQLSPVEREKLHLCPKNCAPYCEEIPAHPTYCTCFCQSPESTNPTKGMKHPHEWSHQR
jgi:hypothetical protein